MNTKNKSRPLQSNDPPSKEQKALEKRMPLQLLLPPAFLKKKKIKQYLSLCTETATNKEPKTET